MEKKYYTIFFLSNGASKTRQLRIPVRFIKPILGIGAVFIFLSAFVVYDYAKLKYNLNELYRLRGENTAQKIELQNFSSKIRGLESRITRLNIFDKKLRIIANIDAPDDAADQQEQVMGMGGGAPADAEDYLANPGAKLGGLVKEMKDDIGKLELKADRQEQSFNELNDGIANKSSFLAAMPSIWPLRGWVTSGYGQRVSPFTGLPQVHKGMDIANRVGTPVLVPASGVVVRVAWDDGLGKAVTISHGYGVKTEFGHLSEVYVRVGQRVKRGMKIAAVGNTGHSTGPHLHYAVNVNGVYVNPNKYILD